MGPRTVAITSSTIVLPPSRPDTFARCFYRQKESRGDLSYRLVVVILIETRSLRRLKLLRRSGVHFSANVRPLSTRFGSSGSEWSRKRRVNRRSVRPPRQRIIPVQILSTIANRLEAPNPSLHLRKLKWTWMRHLPRKDTDQSRNRTAPGPTSRKGRTIP
jgi:hypothetical protein